MGFRFRLPSALALVFLLSAGNTQGALVYSYQEFFDLGLRNRLGIDELHRLEALALRTASRSGRPGSGQLSALGYLGAQLEGGWLIRTAQAAEAHDLGQWQTALVLSGTLGRVQLSAGLMGNAFGLSIPFTLPTPTGDLYAGGSGYADSVSKKFLDDYAALSLRILDVPFLRTIQVCASAAYNQVLPEMAGGRETPLTTPPESIHWGLSVRAALGLLGKVDLQFDSGSWSVPALSLLRAAGGELLLSPLFYRLFARARLAKLDEVTWTPERSDFIASGLWWLSVGPRAIQPSLDAPAGQGSGDPLLRLDMVAPLGKGFGIGAQSTFYCGAWSNVQDGAALHHVRACGLWVLPFERFVSLEAELGLSWLHDRRLLRYGAKQPDTAGVDLAFKAWLGGRRSPVFGFELGYQRNQPDDLFLLPDLLDVNRFHFKFYGVL